MSNFRIMPAEWAPQSAVMLTWPHAGTDWADVLDVVEPVFDAIAKAVLRFQHLIVSCEDADKAASIQTELNDWVVNRGFPGRVKTAAVPADDTWARDHGPITVLENDKLQLLDFNFNAWGDKFPWAKDNAINRQLAESGFFGAAPLQDQDFVLEGGSLESDGAGTLLTTSECLLSTARNPGYDRSQIESKLRDTLGANKVLWLNHGYLAGDDTDSHIDTLARFCSADTICYVRCDDPQDEHFDALNAMERELSQFTNIEGKPYSLVPLPWPDAHFDQDGERLPATYANFLIINGAVLLPIYNVPQDVEAIRTMTALFPDREIIPIDCVPLIHQHGSLHCVTMQFPAGVVTL
ncbi:agmatine deiminase family protein [Marinobacter sp. BGYM27]|uniref:agmatine deiminase family protein n=1 Tax=Marinobacter sp. BGYM27 TaxID=2975597 RepID=UPI0021A7CA7F|nr:agmatine deiminase family protein [Marinobacter sp. BGYM27]MDG5500496.1 agmatine deiminase family protein [Marinobacter sp. BGYM27]